MGLLNNSGYAGTNANNSIQELRNITEELERVHKNTRPIPDEIPVPENNTMSNYYHISTA